MSHLSKTPRKSSTLVIFSPLQTNSISDYQVLLLKRKANMSFSNVLAFPGGVLDQNDIKMFKGISKEHKEITETEEEIYVINRITALRETFEEVGLFFINPKFFDKNEIFSLVQSLREQNNLTFEKLTEKFGLPLKQLVPLLRFITIQNFSKRYDTCFFGVFLNNDDIMALNIGEFLLRNNELSLFSTKNLQINLSESDYFSWITPDKCFLDFYGGKLKLAPPQIFQFGHFCAFPLLKDIEKFYKNDIYRDNNSQNELKKKPFYFPIILDQKKSEKNEIIWIFPGDDDYDFEKIAHNEESIELRNEILQKYKTIICSDKTKKRFVRVFFKRNFLKVKFDMDFVSPLDGLKKIDVMFQKSKL